MPAAKTKTTTSTNGAAKNKTASTSGTATPVSTTDKKDELESLALIAGGRPDKKLYDAEQERIKAEIDGLQVKLSAVRDKISLATKSSAGNDRRNALRTELDAIRDQQSSNKSSRGKTLDQIKNKQDIIQKRIKDIQASKMKIPFKNVAEVDSHIKNLEKQVESGNMKLVDEKRALAEISSTKRNRRVVEGFQAEQDAIEAERRDIDELRKQLDDPESKAVSERYDAIKAELDDLKKESDEAYAGRSKLFEERDQLQNEIKILLGEKRESSQSYRDAHDRYWNKVNEDRARRAEKARTQRAAEESQKKKEIADRILEEAQAPAFQAQIEDCQTLVDYFTGKTTGPVSYKSTTSHDKADVPGVPKLELRKVEDAPEGLVARKKKGEDEADYFVATKGKGKGKKGSAKGPTVVDGTGTAPPASPSATLNVPLPTLSALLSLSIPPPTSSVDVPRVIEDLKSKKAWYEANQARVTAENIAKAEHDIQRLTRGNNETKQEAVSAEPPSPKVQESPETEPKLEESQEPAAVAADT